MPVITYSNDDTYIGDLLGGVRHGQGTLTFVSGDVYVGIFADGLPHGQGTLTFNHDDPDGVFVTGDVYAGAFVDSFRNGQGTLTRPDGTVYVGAWVDDDREGQGTVTYANGDVYSGAWVDNSKTAQGTYTWANGDAYSGAWVDGYWEGQGSLTLANGTVYVGEFKEGTKLDDTLIGAEENNVLFGHEGNDTIQAGAGDDALFGGSGNDTLDGEAGSDTLFGGAGADTFVYEAGDGNDTIIAFEEGVDQISYSGFTDAEIAQFVTTTISGDNTLITLTDGSTILKQAPGFDLTGKVLSRGDGKLSDVAVTADVSNSTTDLTATSSSTGTFALKVDNGASTYLLADMTHVNASPTKAITPQDALEALRLSVGLTTIGGTKTAYDYMAADFNQNGKVTPQDALDILKYSLGLRDLDTDWKFIDSAGDYSGITKSSVSYTEGVSVAAMTADLDVAMMGILLGDVNDTYTGYIDDDPTTGTVTVTGSVKSGSTLTAAHDLTDPDGLTAAVGYQWMADGVAISGATKSTYTLDGSHIDAKVSVNITVSDNMGVETVHSSGMARVTSNSNEILPDYEGSSFYVVLANFSYDEAVADAISRGGKLASITSASEQLDLDYVLLAASEDFRYFPSLAADGGGAAYSWLGANDKVTEGTFIWESGEAFVYQNFGQAEPDNYSGNQNGLAVSYENWPDGASNSDANGSQGQWNDVSTDNKLSYVIEYEPAKPVDAVMVLSFNYENYKKEDVLSKEIDAVSSTLDSRVTAMLNRISDDGEDLVYQAQMNDYTNYLLNDGYTPTATSSALMLTDNITGYKLTAAFANFAPDSIADLTTAFDSFDLADSSTWVISGGLSSLTLSDETGQGIWAITHKADSAKDSVTLTDLQANNGVINALKFEGSNLSNQWNDFVGLLADLETASNAAGATDKSVLSALQDATSGKYALDKISVMAEGVSAPAASLEFKPGGIALSLAEFSMELTAIGSSSTTAFDTDAFLNLVNSDSTNSATAAEVSAALNGAVGGRLSFDHATHGKLMDLTIADFVAFEKMAGIEHVGQGSDGARSFGRKDGDNYVISDHGQVLMKFDNSNMSMGEFYDLINPKFYNEAPTVANPIPDQTVVYGSYFTYQFDGNAFLDLDLDDVLTYTAMTTSSRSDSDWEIIPDENFDPATRTFSGTVEGNLGTYKTKIIATDITGASVSDTFDITVVDAFVTVPDIA